VLPTASAREAALTAPGNLLAADSLLAVCAHLCGRERLERPPVAVDAADAPIFPDLADVRGQAAARRALEIAAAGGHSLLMIGPPGAGKSMLAARLPGLLPRLDPAAARASAAVLSLAGRFRPAEFGCPPYRAPHHSASAVALVGGGNPPRPGEISLAHHGVLFLDELPEFDRKVLESLREPLETGRIHIARAAAGRVPGCFQLVAAMIPVPAAATAARLRLHAGPGRPLPAAGCPVRCSTASTDRRGAGTAADELGTTGRRVYGDGRARAMAAAERQRLRQGKPNARLEGREIDACCATDADGTKLLRQAAERLGLSARGWHRILRVARTIADLAGSTELRSPHVAEAIQYRRHAQ
jgi:magnesium chelatase family protein